MLGLFFAQASGAPLHESAVMARTTLVRDVDLTIGDNELVASRAPRARESRRCSICSACSTCRPPRKCAFADALPLALAARMDRRIQLADGAVVADERS
jgi:hypothetical protein